MGTAHTCAATTHGVALAKIQVRCKVCPKHKV